MTEKSIFELIQPLKAELMSKPGVMFSSPGRYIYQGVQVFFHTLNDYPQGSKNNEIVANTLIAFGGALAGYYMPEHLPQLLKDIEEITDEKVRSSFEMIEVGHGVVLLAEFFNELSEEEQRAILEHELAHISLGHQGLTSSDGQLVVNVQNELDADLEASKKVSKKAMLLAIVKLVGIRAKFMGTSLGLSDAEAKENFKLELEDPAISTRIKALL